MKIEVLKVKYFVFSTFSSNIIGFGCDAINTKFHDLGT